MSDVAVSSAAVLRIPATPPSFNAIGLHSHWSKGRKAKKQWQEWFEVALMATVVPRHWDRVEATAAIHFSQRRRRDEGNFRVILEKALGDALVNGGWLPDDTAGHYSFGGVRLLAPMRVPETVVKLALRR